MIKNFLLLVSFFVFGTAICQDFDNKILFTIDEEPIYASEFLSVYNKNLDLVQEGSQRNVEDYLQMFINYKLKVKEAYELGLDDQEAFLREYNNYRNQLAHRFMTDANVTKALVEEAYERSVEEINAAHILLRLDEDAAPADTLKVYNNAMDLRKKIMDGEDFHVVAKQFSEDPSVRQNQGELGWFGVFKMVYPFEEAAYNTGVGNISMPVRTNFGYHLIKVNDKRKSQGEVTAAHIMITGNNDKDTEAEIKNIYQQLQNGANFEELAREHSDDQATAKKGGKLNPFGMGTLRSPEFEKAAFSLQQPGDISEPVNSEYGWHIIKLIHKKSPGSFEEMKSKLETDVKKDARSRIITEAFVEDLKKKYKIKKQQETLESLQSYVGEEILKGKWTPENNPAVKGKELLRIKDTVITYGDFFAHIQDKQLKPLPVTNKNQLVEKWHDDFINKFVLDFHRNNLEEENKEFAAVTKEYKEGLLLFDLMEQKIWNQAKKDSVGLKTFYQTNPDKYSKNLEDIKGLVINDYQAHLEEEWLKQLRNASEINIRKKTLKKIKKSVE